MSYIVIHDDGDNITHYAEFDDVQAAASHLEELHNREGGSNARLFALDPIEFAVKSYVRVEIAATDGDAEVAPATPVSADHEVFTDASADDAGAADDPAVEYVVAPSEPTDDPTLDAPVSVLAELEELADLAEEPVTGEVRRGLFGR